MRQEHIRAIAGIPLPHGNLSNSTWPPDPDVGSISTNLLIAICLAVLVDSTFI